MICSSFAGVGINPFKPAVSRSLYQLNKLARDSLTVPPVFAFALRISSTKDGSNVPFLRPFKTALIALFFPHVTAKLSIASKIAARASAVSRCHALASDKSASSGRSITAFDRRSGTLDNERRASSSLALAGKLDTLYSLPPPRPHRGRDCQCSVSAFLINPIFVVGTSGNFRSASS